MRTLREILLMAANVAGATWNDEGCIKVWPFDDAPPELQALSQSGGDEDWLAVVPDTLAERYIPWLDRLGVCAVDQYPIAGAVVYIGSHA